MNLLSHIYHLFKCLQYKQQKFNIIFVRIINATAFSLIIFLQSICADLTTVGRIFCYPQHFLLLPEFSDPFLFQLLNTTISIILVLRNKAIFFLIANDLNIILISLVFFFYTLLRSNTLISPIRNPFCKFSSEPMSSFSSVSGAPHH